MSIEKTMSGIVEAERRAARASGLAIGSLKTTLAGLEVELGKHQYWAGYHQDEWLKEGTIVASLTDQVAALRSTIALLEKV